ncbi:restriction endonuclease subunit S [Desulfocastanea catecholica]
MRWQRKPLEDIADFTLGKMLDQKKNKGDLHPYLANVNVRWGSFQLDDLREMRFEPHEVDRYGLKYGDIVMCEGGEPGRCAIWKDLDHGPKMMIQKALHRIRSHVGVDNRFLFYSFLHIGKTGGFAPLFTGSTIKHLPREKLAKVEVDIPPIQTQHKVSYILSTYDSLIENNRRRMTLLEDAARQVYQEWFVRLRFPGREHTHIVDGVPEGWERRKLGDLADINRENLNNSSDGKIEYIDIASVSPGQINETTQYDLRDAPSRARRVVKHGDIIWSCVRPNRRSHAVIWNPSENLIASTGFVVISPRYLPTSFLYQALTTNSFVGYLENHAKGVAYPAVVASDFERAEILVPKDSLVSTFNDFVEPQMSKIHNLRFQNQKLRTARDLLLPKLMSWEITV